MDSTETAANTHKQAGKMCTVHIEHSAASTETETTQSFAGQLDASRVVAHFYDFGSEKFLFCAHLKPLQVDCISSSIMDGAEAAAEATAGAAHL